MSEVGNAARVQPRATREEAHACMHAQGHTCHNNPAIMPPLPDQFSGAGVGLLRPDAVAACEWVMPVLVLAALAASLWFGIKGGMASVFTTTITRFKIRSLNQRLKGKVVALELYGLLHKKLRSGLAGSVAHQKAAAMHCVGKTNLVDFQRQDIIVDDALQVVANMLCAGMRRVVVVLEGGGDGKLARGQRAARRLASWEASDYKACLTVPDCMMKRLLQRLMDAHPGCCEHAAGAKVWVVLPPGDADLQIAHDLRTGAVHAAVIPSHDTDMVFFPGIKNVIYNFTANSLGGCAGFVYPQDVGNGIGWNNLTAYSYPPSCGRAEGDKTTLFSWRPWKRLATAVLTGCDFYSIRDMAHITAVDVMLRLWVDPPGKESELLSLGANIARIDAHCVDLAAKIKDPTKRPGRSYTAGFCAMVYQRVVVLGTPRETVPAYDSVHAATWPGYPHAWLGDPWEGQRHKPLIEIYKHHGDEGCRDNYVEAPLAKVAAPTRKACLDKSLYYPVKATEDGATATAGVPIVRFTTIYDWMEKHTGTCRD